MRTSLRAALGAALTTAVGLTLLAGTATATDDRASGNRTAIAVQKARIAERLEAALAPKKLPARKLGNPLPRQDLTLLLREAQTAKVKVAGRSGSIIDGGRPDPAAGACTDYTPLLQATWKVVQSAHFCVHYRDGLTLNGGGATFQQAQTTLAVLENEVYTKEITQLGFNPPPNDGDGKTDVFLDQMGDQGYYGFCKTDTGSSVSSSWCGLDNDFAVDEFGAPPLNSLRVTAAHEFFHAVQFGYDADDATFLLEGSAVWMEDQVYPAINDYLQYLKYSQVVLPRNSTDYVGTLHRYGAVTFWKYLSERFRDTDIIRKIWTAASVAQGGRNAIQATAAVISGKKSTLAKEFARYGVWNTLPPGTYADRAKWPSPGAWARGTLTKKNRDTKVLKVRLNHLATAPLVLQAGTNLPTRTRLRIIVDAPNLNRGSQAWVQLRYKNGKVVLTTVPLNSLGNGVKVVKFNRTYVRSVIVTLSNGSGGYNNQEFKVRVRAVW